MPKVKVSELKDGMVLEEDLLAPNGRFILPKGAVIRDSYIKTLKAWGVVEASVAQEGSIPPVKREGSSSDAAFMERARELLSPFFHSKGAMAPHMEELFRCSSMALARALKRGGHVPLVDIGCLPPARQGARRKLSPQELAAMVSFVTLPDVYHKIGEVVSRPSSSVEQIARVVSKDQSLSAKLLRLVNSSFYGLASRVESVSRAITIVGVRELMTLAMGISVVSAFKGVAPGYVSMRSFWDHSVCCGVFARVLAAKMGLKEEERFFLAGLMHDIGRMILYVKAPFAMAEAVALSSKGMPLYEAEREVLGFDHAHLGYYAMKEWKIPSSIYELVRFHHNPSGAKVPEEVLIHVADAFAVASRFGTSGSLMVPEISPYHWDLLGFSVNVIEPVFVQAERQVREISGIFFPSREED
ncbi:putative signal transduction protein [Thermanaerovibrio velox DSM 12556]|uniref:Putative signal transduction protein n=1 Tax=Thermanaerovibrio velox DSM 12556 TaxID=926567 RepID=H0UQQ0_9BACT|nr:HDOD domain-containing protein [Thermanaerovibrio velox]EHM10814.1 putative signal transduction protein [Thermanaerovibrio velox DSM 12556]MCX7828756.1 HDOD domain-containing protein [Thermanaerothrix sp.]